MNIKPVNGHVLIEPLTHETFIKSERESYEEIGIVVDFDDTLFGVKKGLRVFFDSWLAAKYPTGEGDTYFWLVPWQDVRAVSHEND